MLRADYIPDKGFAIDQTKLVTAHRGLLLDKYFAPKRPGDKKQGEKDGTLPQWKSLCESGLTPAAYTLAYNRWLDYTSKSLDRCVAFKGALRSRMAIGLGIENVHEIGCRLHATYGVPVIPGSSLKGLLRAGLSRMPDYAEYITPLFGPPPGSTQEASRGAVEVFDAWWVPAPGRSGLAPDVITVHHQSYYSSAGKSLPQDRESPIPNHFLTVTGEFYFSFRVLADEDSQKWGAFIRDAAQAFLKTEGIGGKRSAGYGRFSKFTPVR
jgi:CRISPR-associated protein Cmr6